MTDATHAVLVRFDISVYRRLCELAADAERSVSGEVRAAVKAWLDESEKVRGVAE